MAPHLRGRFDTEKVTNNRCLTVDLRNYVKKVCELF